MYMILIHIVYIQLIHCFILPTKDEFLAKSLMTWSEAENHCLSTYNTHLVSIHDSFTFSRLLIEIQDKKWHTFDFWIGLINDADNNDTWSFKWSDNSLFNFGADLSGIYPWFDEQPSESASTLTAVRLWGGSASLLWDDADINEKYFWICNDIQVIPTTTIPSVSSINFVVDSQTKTTTNVIHTPSSNHDVNNSTNYTDKSGETDVDDDDGVSTEINHFWKFAIIVVLTLSCCVILWMYHLYRIKIIEVNVWRRKQTRHHMDINDIESASVKYDGLDTTNITRPPRPLSAIKASSYTPRFGSIAFTRSSNLKKSLRRKSTTNTKQNYIRSDTALNEVDEPETEIEKMMNNTDDGHCHHVHVVTHHHDTAQPPPISYQHQHQQNGKIQPISSHQHQHNLSQLQLLNQSSNQHHLTSTTTTTTTTKQSKSKSKSKSKSLRGGYEQTQTHTANSNELSMPNEDMTSTTSLTRPPSPNEVTSYHTRGHTVGGTLETKQISASTTFNAPPLPLSPTDKGDNNNQSQQTIKANTSSLVTAPNIPSTLESPRSPQSQSAATLESEYYVNNNNHHHQYQQQTNYYHKHLQRHTSNPHHNRNLSIKHLKTKLSIDENEGSITGDPHHQRYNVKKMSYATNTTQASYKEGNASSPTLVYDGGVMAHAHSALSPSQYNLSRDVSLRFFENNHPQLNNHRHHSRRVPIEKEHTMPSMLVEPDDDMMFDRNKYSKSHLQKISELNDANKTPRIMSPDAETASLHTNLDHIYMAGRVMAHKYVMTKLAENGHRETGGIGLNMPPTSMSVLSVASDDSNVTYTNTITHTHQHHLPRQDSLSLRGQYDTISFGLKNKTMNADNINFRFDNLSCKLDEFDEDFDDESQKNINLEHEEKKSDDDDKLDGERKHKKNTLSVYQTHERVVTANTNLTVDHGASDTYTDFNMSVNDVMSMSRAETSDEETSVDDIKSNIMTEQDMHDQKIRQCAPGSISEDSTKNTMSVGSGHSPQPPSQSQSGSGVASTMTVMTPANTIKQRSQSKHDVINSNKASFSSDTNSGTLIEVHNDIEVENEVDGQKRDRKKNLSVEHKKGVKRNISHISANLERIKKLTSPIVSPLVTPKPSSFVIESGSE